MTVAEKLALKQKLLVQGKFLLQERIQLCLQAIDDAQLAANAEEKSSAGDKFETSRAMSHIEKDLKSRQLQANQDELQALLSVNVEEIYPKVQTGAVILGEQHIFFIAAGLGKVVVECEMIYFLSPIAPLATLLWGKHTGDRFLFNREYIIIKDVF